MNKHKEAFYNQIDQFYSGNFDMLCKRVRSRGCTPEDAEDVVHEAFVRALNYWKAFSPERQEMGAWFNTIMNNALRDFKKIERRKGGVSYKEVDEEPEEELNLAADVMEVCSDVLEGIVKEFNDEHQKILNLFFQYEYKPREISQILDLKGANVRKVISRCRKRLMEEFNEGLCS